MGAWAGAGARWRGLGLNGISMTSTQVVTGQGLADSLGNRPISIKSHGALDPGPSHG